MNDNYIPETDTLKYYSRPENTYDPPSPEDILFEWEKDDIPIPFTNEDGLPYLTFKKEDIHICIHRCHPDSVKYKVAFVLSDKDGFVYLCDCYSNEQAAKMYLLGGIVMLSGLLGNTEGFTS